MATEVSLIKKSRGRPKVFDRDDALEKAMALFWQHGYEATSLSHLVEATGAKAPTLYAEFTNKEGLFRAVLDHYIARFAKKYEAQLFAPGKAIEQALEEYLLAIAHCFTDKETPSGCFIVCTSSVLAASSQDIASTIRERHAVQQEMLLLFLNEHQQKGTLPQSCNTQHLARYLCCIIRGMSVNARDGATYEDLVSIVKTTIMLLPELKKQ